MESISSEILDLWASFFLRTLEVECRWEFNIDTQKVEKVQQEINDFLGNLIWIGNGIFSLLLREYS